MASIRTPLYSKLVETGVYMILWNDDVYVSSLASKSNIVTMVQRSLSALLSAVFAPETFFPDARGTKHRRQISGVDF